jgi:anti-anti-sigma factor
LVRAQQELEGIGRRLVLVNPHPAVRRVLDLTGLSDVLPSTETTSAALAQMRPSTDGRPD